MKKILLLLLIINLGPECLLSQDSASKAKHVNKMYFGITLGTSLSQYIAGSENEKGGLATYTTYNVTYEKQPRIGFTAGCFIEIPVKKHFSIRTDLDYYLTKHRILYVQENGGAITSDCYGDYYLTGSDIQLSILPKFSIGKRNLVYLMIGPYFDLFTRSDAKGQIEIKSPYYPGHPASDSIISNNGIGSRINGIFGLWAGLGLNVPVKGNLFSIEMKSGYGFTNIVSSPNMRQIIMTLCIIYQFKI